MTLNATAPRSLETATVTPSEPHFNREEYQHRLALTQSRMEELGFDALILHQPENVSWLGGFWHDGFFSYHSLVVPRSGDPRLVIRALENPVAEACSWVVDRHRYFDGEDPLDFLADALEEVCDSGATIGLEFDSFYLPVERFEKIRTRFHHHTFVSSQRLVEKLQRIKSPQELAYLHKAGQIVSAAMAAGVEAVREGANELEVGAAIAQAQALSGHDGILGGLGGAIVTGERTRQLHAMQDNRIIAAGDKFRLELAGIHKQYWAKQMRAGMVGPVSDAVLRATDVLRTAQDDAISKMAPGVAASEIADACRNPILSSGIAERYDNRVGYGLGLQFHPTSGDFSLDIDARSDYALEAGMVFHMLLFAGGAAISETVAVTSTGHEILTSTPRETFSR